MQTCFDLFGETEGIEIYVDPLLHPRINSTSAIPANLEDVLSKFRTQPYIGKIEDKNWFLSYARSSINV